MNQSRYVFLLLFAAVLLPALLALVLVSKIQPSEQTFVRPVLTEDTTTSTQAPPEPQERPQPTTTTAAPKYTKSQRSELLEASVGPCGRDLPPCSVVLRESGGDPSAVNPTGCGGRGCYGKWQFDPVTFIPGCTVSKWNDGTCGTYQGYQFANEAPEEVQDARAREIYANGRGCSHWDVCG